MSKEMENIIYDLILNPSPDLSSVSLSTYYRHLQIGSITESFYSYYWSFSGRKELCPEGNSISLKHYSFSGGPYLPLVSI